MSKKYVRYIDEVKAWERLNDRQRAHLNSTGCHWEKEKKRYVLGDGTVVDNEFWRRYESSC